MRPRNKLLGVYGTGRRRSAGQEEPAFAQGLPARSPIGRCPFGEADFLDRTIAIWQSKANRKLTREDAREIVENMAGLFRILDEWDKAEKAKD
jgi:hypothetical protein